MKSYRDYMKAIGRKPLPRNLRTKKGEGESEIVWDNKLKKYVKHVHETEAVGNVVQFKGKRRA